MDARDRGRRLRADADSRTARGVPRPHAGAERARSAASRGAWVRNRRRSSARLHRLADGRALQDDLGRRLARRNLRRPGRGEGIRQIHPARLARSRPGIAGSGGRLRVRLWLRLLQHDLVAQRDHAAADGEPPARHLRAPVRRRRHDRSEDAFGAAAGGPQHPRCRHRGRQAAARQARRIGPRQDRPVSGGGARRRAAHPAGGGAGRPRPAADRRSRRHPAGLLGILQADDRSHGSRLADRHDARLHVPDRPRDERPRLSGSRIRRRPSFRDASPGRSREDREGHPDQHLPHQDAGLLSRQAARHAGRRRLAARSRA